MAVDPIIAVKNVTKKFYTTEIETTALDSISFSVGRGEFLAFSGPSGCGKSTLLSILGLLDVPTIGSYELAGCAVANLGHNQRAAIRNKEIGFIFQAFNLISDLTVSENVELPLIYRCGLTKSQRKQAVLDTLERVGIGHRVNHKPSQLSGGQQQRVAIARALVGKPQLLLADEPTGNLDSDNAIGVMQLLRELHEAGSTICMVTHDPRSANFAERQINIIDGKITSDERASAHEDSGIKSTSYCV